MKDDVTKASPHAVGPEKSILSTMLQDPLEYIGIAIEEGLTEAHFYQPAHQIIYAEMLLCYEQSVPIELVSFVQLLLDIGKLHMIGGPATLTDIYTYSPSAGHFHYHLKFVKDKFTMRSVLNFCATTEQAVWDEPADVEPLLDTAPKLPSWRSARGGSQ